MGACGPVGEHDEPYVRLDGPQAPAKRVSDGTGLAQHGDPRSQLSDGELQRNAIEFLTHDYQTAVLAEQLAQPAPDHRAELGEHDGDAAVDDLRGRHHTPRSPASPASFRF